jgi:hypothetical protein
MRPHGILALLPACLAVAGCGLPDDYYLVPPALSTPVMQELTSTCTLQGTGRSDDILVTFMGYDLYYKLSAAAPTTDAGYGSATSSVATLKSNGFYRVCRGPGSVPGLAADTSPSAVSEPLIDISVIDPGSIDAAYGVTVTFNAVTTPDFGFSVTGNPVAPISYYAYTPPLGSAPTAGMEIRRATQADVGLGNVCKTFAPDDCYRASFINYSTQDSDGVTSAIRSAALSNGGSIYVTLYAVSYGKAADNTYQTSSPTYLGCTKLQVIYN